MDRTGSSRQAQTQIERQGRLLPAAHPERSVLSVFVSTQETKDDWPFADPKNVAVFTTRQVLRLGQPILYVTHDDDDGAWQFHTGAGEASADDAMIVALREMAEHDPTILQLADLPCGWFAERDSTGSPWRKRRLV